MTRAPVSNEATILVAGETPPDTPLKTTTTTTPTAAEEKETGEVRNRISLRKNRVKRLAFGIAPPPPPLPRPESERKRAKAAEAEKRKEVRTTHSNILINLLFFFICLCRLCCRVASSSTSANWFGESCRVSIGGRRSSFTIGRRSRRRRRAVTRGFVGSETSNIRE